MPLPMDTISSLYYRNLVDLPLSKFIEITTTGLLYPLIISGEPSKQELAEAWESIIEQYSSHMGNAEQQLYLSLYKEINKLSAAIEEVRICVHWLKDGYNGRLVSRLNNVLGTTFTFDIKRPEEYDKNLQKCINRSKGFKVNLDLKMAQFEAIKQKQEATDQATPTKEYYQSILITLRGSEGYFIESEKISVFEFCEMIKRWNKKVEQAKK